MGMKEGFIKLLSIARFELLTDVKSDFFGGD